jgi:hypothetical protein
MATYNKFDTFVDDLAGKVHDLKGTAGSTADVCKVALSNSAPIASNATFSAITEIGAGNGYVAGGTSTANSGSSTTGTFTLTGTNVTWTASGGTIGAFRYVVLYNDTPTSPADPTIAWWDYGSGLTLNDGESFTVKFNNGASSGTIFTLT